MTGLREAAQQAVAYLDGAAYAFEAAADGRAVTFSAYGKNCRDAAASVRAALAEPQSTHSADCFKWHHKCAVAEVERLRAALAEQNTIIPPKIKGDKLQQPDAYCVTTSDGGCVSTDPRCMHNALATVPSECPDSRQPKPPKASAAGHGMAWPGLACSGLARSSQTGNGGQR